MKLNLDFTKYIGTTRLKQWWKEVKTHFTQVQTAHNDLEDAVAAESTKLTTEITQRTTADVALSDRINAEANTRETMGSTLGQRITAETNARQAEDTNLQTQINKKIDTIEIFGGTVTRTFKVVMPKEIPEPQFKDSQQYYGENITIIPPYDQMTMYIDNKPVKSWDTGDIIIPTEGETYVYFSYDAESNDGCIFAGSTPAQEGLPGNVLKINLWKYSDITSDFAISSDSPTGDLYKYQRCNKEYVSANTDTTNATYTVTQTYTARRTRDDLLTDNKNSILDAVNENAEKIKNVQSEMDTFNETTAALDEHLVDAESKIENIRTITDKLKNVDVSEAENALDEACYGEILKLTNPEDENTYSEIKIRRERDVDNKYPNAVEGNTGSTTNNADIFYMVGMSGTVNKLVIEDYEFDVVNPMTLPAESKVYFRLIEECVSTIDGYTPGKVSIIDVYSWHDAMYIKTNGAEEYTKVAMKEDIDKEVSSVKSTLPNIKKNPDAEDGDIVDTHMTVGTRAAESVCGFGSFVSGEENAASKDNSGVIGGARNTANGLFSVIIGGADNKVLPTGTKSVIIGGDNNQANTINCVIIGGVNAVAARCNVVFGHRNVAPQGAGTAGIIGDAIVVGNGTVESESNAFRVAYNGNVYCGGEYSSTGADYAEMFEWVDGNPDDEDRRGLFAYIENGKMRLANSADTDRRRIGVISARPAVVGDDFDDRWCGKYMTDVFGAVMTHIVHHDAEEYTVMAKDPETGERVPKTEIIEAYDAEEPIINPDYDPEQPYIPRAQRKEYDCWAFMGKLVVCDDGTCEANGYCYPSENGIATAAEDGFYVLERIDETHVKVLIK